MSKLQLTDLWYALLGFRNPPLPFSVINMKHIKNLKKTRSKWGICKNLKLLLNNFNRTQKSLKHELHHKISHLGNSKKVKEVTSLSISPPPPHLLWSRVHTHYWSPTNIDYQDIITNLSRHCTTKPLAEFFPLSHFPIWPTTIQTQGFDVFTYSFLMADLEVESWIKVWVLNKTQIQFVENFTFFFFPKCRYGCVECLIVGYWLVMGFLN